MDWGTLNRSETLSVPDRLSIDLERLILEGQLEVGERLPSERELSELLSVSRVSIRQALHELENRGLISRKPGRGTVVLSQRAAGAEMGEGLARVLDRGASPEIAHIMELRAIIEPPIAGITAARATPRDLGQLRELLAEMDGDISSTRYAELDRSFHQSIAQYTHNPLLAMLNEQIAAIIAPSRDAPLQTKARRKASTEAHRRIYEAIAAADPEAAETAAREHVRSVQTEIVRATAANHPSTDPTKG